MANPLQLFPCWPFHQILNSSFFCKNSISNSILSRFSPSTFENVHICCWTLLLSPPPQDHSIYTLCLCL
jgi:hypothetical protein